MATAKKQKDGTWRIQPCVTILGEKRRTNIRADSKREAERLAQEWIESQGVQKKTNITLGEAVEAYIENRRSSFSPSTVRNYFVIRRNAVPLLMDEKIEKITAERVQSEMNAYALTHAPKTARNVHSLISATLKAYAPHIKLNTTLPRKEKEDIRIPSPEEVDIILEQCANLTLQIPILLALFCGLRASEIAALKAENVKDGYIIIKEAMVRGENGQELKGPKSNSGYRNIPCADDLCERLRAAAKNSDSGRVTKMSSTRISNKWGDFSKRLPMPHIKFHALRHYYASYALLHQVPIDYVAEMMGHSSRDMIERVYKHLFPKEQFRFASMIIEEYNTKMKISNQEVSQKVSQESEKTLKAQGF